MSIVAVVALVFVLSMFRFRVGGRLRGRGRDFFSETVASAEEVAELERRVAGMEQLEARVLELENRLDFAERLLTSRTGQGSGAP